MTRSLLPKTVRLLLLVAILGFVAFMVHALRQDDKGFADIMAVFVIVPTYFVWLFKYDFWNAKLTRRSFLVPVAYLICLCGLFYFGLLMWDIRSSATRMSIANDLKQIGLALLNYEEKHGCLPPAYTQSQEGKPLLSWRVLLLPYLEQDKLFNQFHIDEPWDSPHNLALIQASPRIYCRLDLAAQGPGMTYYRVFGGPDTLFAPGKSLNIKRDIVDPADKAVVFESSEAVAWTKPESLPFEPASFSHPFGATRVAGWPLHWSEWRSEIFGCLMADGSVQFLPTNLGGNELSKLMLLKAQPDHK